MENQVSSDTYQMDWGAFGLIEFLTSEQINIPGQYKRALDIGSGAGVQTMLMRRFGLEVEQLDKYQANAEIREDFIHHEFDHKYDVVFCSHVVEHQRNPGLFLDKIFDVLADEGVLILSAPKHEAERFIEGHLTCWFLPLMIQNLIHAGFDCKTGKIISAGAIENCCIVKKAKNFSLDERQEAGYQWTAAHRERSPYNLEAGLEIMNIKFIFENCQFWKLNANSTENNINLKYSFLDDYTYMGLTIDMSRWGLKFQI